MGVLLRITFSHTPDEAKSGGLAKACVPGKNYSVPEKRVTKLFTLRLKTERKTPDWNHCRVALFAT